MKKVFHGWVNLESEDNGCALISESLSDDSDNGMWVQIGSWCNDKTHTDIKQFENRPVIITIEAMD